MRLYRITERATRVSCTCFFTHKCVRARIPISARKQHPNSQVLDFISSPLMISSLDFHPDFLSNLTNDQKTNSSSWLYQNYFLQNFISVSFKNVYDCTNENENWQNFEFGDVLSSEEKWNKIV